MEALLDDADALSLMGGGCPPRPDFAIPHEFVNHEQRTAELLELKDCPNKGKGWFARQNIPAGTVLIVDKPLAMMMDWQDDTDEGDEEAQNDEEPRLNVLLLLQLLSDIHQNPAIWTNALTELFPREGDKLGRLPPWVYNDDETFMQVETLIQQFETVPVLKGAVAKDIAKRLPLIIRYNILSVETCPELLSHPGPGGHAAMGGVGLYHLPSFFNHSARPNISRWAIGDVMWFVANRDIAAGTEACISYIEHDVLCESSYRRNLMLQMDFSDNTDDDRDNQGGASEEDGPDMPVVDSDVQNELMGMDPVTRLSSIEELMLQAQGLKAPGGAVDEDDTGNSEMKEDSENDIMEVEGSGWFQCDLQNLRILQAITLEGLGQTAKALNIWEECVYFTETQLPPLDENSVVMRVQSALCSLHLGNVARAKEHAEKALETHQKLYGGGPARLRRRYQRDFRLSLRPETTTANGGVTGIAAIDVLWPLNLKPRSK